MDTTMLLYIETSKQEKITRDDLITELSKRGINFFSEKHNDLAYFVKKEEKILRQLLSNQLIVGIESTQENLKKDELVMKFNPYETPLKNPIFFPLFDEEPTDSLRENEIQFARSIRKNWADYMEIMVGMDHLRPQKGLQNQFVNVPKKVIYQFNGNCPMKLESGIYLLNFHLITPSDIKYFLIKE